VPSCPVHRAFLFLFILSAPANAFSLRVARHILLPSPSLLLLLPPPLLLLLLLVKFVNAFHDRTRTYDYVLGCFLVG